MPRAPRCARGCDNQTKAAKVVPITAMPVLARLLHSSVPMGSRGSIRYAVVGLGHIAQVPLPPFHDGRRPSARQRPTL